MLSEVADYVRLDGKKCPKQWATMPVRVRVLQHSRKEIVQVEK